MSRTCFSCINSIIWFDNKDNSFKLGYASCSLESTDEETGDYIIALLVSAPDKTNIEPFMGRQCKYFKLKFGEQCWICKCPISRPNWDVDKLDIQSLCCNNKKCINSLKKIVRQKTLTSTSISREEKDWSPKEINILQSIIDRLKK